MRVVLCRRNRTCDWHRSLNVLLDFKHHLSPNIFTTPSIKSSFYSICDWKHTVLIPIPLQSFELPRITLCLLWKWAPGSEAPLISSDESYKFPSTLLRMPYFFHTGYTTMLAVCRCSCNRPCPVKISITRSISFLMCSRRRPRSDLLNGFDCQIWCICSMPFRDNKHAFLVPVADLAIRLKTRIRYRICCSFSGRLFVVFDFWIFRNPKYSHNILPGTAFIDMFV